MTQPIRPFGPILALAIAILALGFHTSCAPPGANGPAASGEVSINVTSRQEETAGDYKISTIFHSGGKSADEVKRVFVEHTVDAYHFLYDGNDGQTITVDVQPTSGEPTPKDLTVETTLHEGESSPAAPISWKISPTNKGSRARAVFHTSPKVTRVETKVKAS